MGKSSIRGNSLNSRRRMKNDDSLMDETGCGGARRYSNENIGLLGEQKLIQGSVKSVDFVDEHRVVLEKDAKE